MNAVLRYSNVLHLHQQVCHNNGDTMVRTSRFTEANLMNFRESLEELPGSEVTEDQKTMAVWSMMWMVQRRKEEKMGMRDAKETEDAMQEETAGEIHVHPDFWGCLRRRILRVMKQEPTTQGVHVESRGAGASSENKLGNLAKLVDRRREERRRLEKEGNEIMELLKKHEEREEELEEEKHVEDKLEKWADRQRLERKGDEIMELLKKHEEREEELEEEKHMEDKLEKWADRQRLERKGDETVEVMRRHEGKEEELKEKGKRQWKN